jgi:acyl-CoA dehydrogenase
LGGEWQKCFITGADGAGVGIVMARSEEEDAPGACMFLVDLPDPAITITPRPTPSTIRCPAPMPN